MGSYKNVKQSEFDDEGVEDASETGTANADRVAAQATLGGVTEGTESAQEEFDLTDNQIEQVEEAAATEDFAEQGADEVGEEVARELARSHNQGMFTEAALGRLAIDVQDSGIEGEDAPDRLSDADGIARARESTGAIPAGRTQTLAIDDDMEVTEAEIARTVNGLELYANGIRPGDAQKAQQLRQDSRTGDDVYYDPAERDGLYLVESNANLSQERAVRIKDSFNDTFDTIHDEKMSVMGGRDNADDVAKTADELYRNMAEEVSTQYQGDNSSGTNLWNYGNDALHSLDQDADVEFSEEYQREVDILHAASKDLDIVADSSWDADGAVFDEDNLTQQKVDGWVSVKMSNTREGAGSSRNLIQEVQSWAEENLPEE